MRSEFCLQVRNAFLIPFVILASLFYSARVHAEDAKQLMVVDYEYKDPAKAFKMQVPSDWNVKENQNGYALFLEPKEKVMPTAESPIAADPNITVAVINTPMFIDEQSLDEYALDIEKKFKATNGEGSEFQIYSKHLMKDLPGNRSGLLYYVVYKNNNVDVGATILVMSNNSYLYRVTYTDYKFAYDKNFERYFPVMASINVVGDAPERQNVLVGAIPWVGGLAVLIVALFLMKRAREKKMEQMIREVGGDSGSYSGSSSGSSGGRSKKHSHSSAHGSGHGSSAGSSSPGSSAGHSSAGNSSNPGSNAGKGSNPGSYPED